MRYVTKAEILCDGKVENPDGSTFPCSARAQVEVTTTMTDAGAETRISKVPGWVGRRTVPGVLVAPGIDNRKPGRVEVFCPACAAGGVSKRVDNAPIPAIGEGEG